MNDVNLIVLGGGAAGLFAAITAKILHPSHKVLLLEKTGKLLSKVSISGGGRCNLTHACEDIQEFASHYPRGGQELLSAFYRFQPQDTLEWFESRGVPLKTEEDGRVFPTSNQSESIVHCLIEEASRVGVEIRLNQKIVSIAKQKEGFTITLEEGELSSSKLVLATGSSAEGYQWAKELGHTIQEPVPSLFTFNVPTSSLKELSGIAVDPVTVDLFGKSFKQQGALLITHFGFSGPAVIKLSAWAARYLYEKNYQEKLIIDWLPSQTQEETFALLLQLKKHSPDKFLTAENPFSLPKKLWKKQVELTLNANESPLRDISHSSLRHLSSKLHRDLYSIEGKTAHRQEFVTCGGVTLKEVDFKTMESKVCPGLFFAGEILDIDGLTGGFNLQNAWSTGFIAGSYSR